MNMKLELVAVPVTDIDRGLEPTEARNMCFYL